MPPAFKTAYLIHGDDHGRIAERRARLRELAEQQSGAQGVELFEGDQATPDDVAAALNAMTFAIGRRFIIVDGAERWKDKEMDALEAALAAIAPDTTVTFFAREDGRLKAPKRLHDAVKKAGGDICRRTVGQAVGAAQVGGRAGAPARPRAHAGGRADARQPRRRAPAATAAGAREAGARARVPARHQATTIDADRCSS